MRTAGEASLNAAVITLAQQYAGSNNCSLLYPDGQFGEHPVLRS